MNDNEWMTMKNLLFLIKNSIAIENMRLTWDFFIYEKLPVSILLIILFTSYSCVYFASYSTYSILLILLLTQLILYFLFMGLFYFLFYLILLILYFQCVYFTSYYIDFKPDTNWPPFLFSVTLLLIHVFIIFLIRYFLFMCLLYFLFHWCHAWHHQFPLHLRV